MKSLARVRVLVKMRPVEVGKTMLVFRKMRWHPIEDHAYAMGMQVVHEVHQILRRAIACRGREIAGRLISPGTVEGMFGDRHELDMRKTQCADILCQLVSQFP